MTPQAAAALPNLLAAVRALERRNASNPNPNPDPNPNQATRLFASNMNPRMAQRFFNLVLLPAVQVRVRVRDRARPHP